MSDSKKYVPLSERLHQDVWHDNFVPKYSGLASVKPSLLVVIGVWLIFAPAGLGSLVLGLSALSDVQDISTTVISSVFTILFTVLSIAILYTQTSRYLLAKRVRSQKVDTEGYDTEGYDTEGYDSEGYDSEGHVQ